MEPLPMCPRCGATVQPEWTFCRDCGYAPDAAAVETDLGEEAAAIAAPPAPEGGGPTPPEPTAPPAAAPGFGPSPGFGAATEAPEPSGSAGLSGTDLPIVGSSWGDEAGASGADESPVAGWGPSSGTGFDAPSPSSFSTGGQPAPGFGFEPAAEPPSSSEGAFDPSAFDPDALAGTPYEEPEPPPFAPVAPSAPAPITFQSMASDTPGGPPGLPASFGADAPPPIPPGAGGPVGGPSGGSSSPFSINRVVAIGAVVIGAMILIGGILLLTGGSKDTATGTTGKTTPPPLGAIAVTSTTAFDPLAPATTTTVPPGAQRECDTIAIMHSVDGSDYTPCNAGFKVQFPGRPDTHVVDADISMGRVQFNLHSSTSPDPTEPIRYEAGWATLPKEPTPDEAVEAMGALTAKMGCSLTGPITFQGQPAYACKGAGDGAPDPKNPTVATGIAFVRGTHVYALMTTSYSATQKQLDTFAATFTPV